MFVEACPDLTPLELSPALQDVVDELLDFVHFYICVVIGCLLGQDLDQVLLCQGAVSRRLKCAQYQRRWRQLLRLLKHAVL